MNITRLVEKIFIRSFLLVTLFGLLSCSNTLIGEKLESSFDSMEKPRTPEKTNIKPQKPNEKTKIKSMRFQKNDRSFPKRLVTSVQNTLKIGCGTYRQPLSKKMQPSLLIGRTLTNF